MYNGRMSVECLSVCATNLQSHSAAEGLLLCARLAGEISTDCSWLYGTAGAAQHGAQQQMRAVPR